VSIPNTETTATSDEATPLTTEQSGKGGTQRRTAVRWKLFLLLLVLVSVNYIDRGSISVALPIIQKEFNLPPELVGLLLSAFFWTYALMQVPVGWLIDKFGPRKVMTASCLGWGAATAASGMAGGFLSMFIARLGIGVTEAGVMPAGGKLNAIWMHKSERGRGATILDAGAPLGAGLGGIIIAGLIASTGSWRWSFVIAGAATVLMGLAVWWYVRDNPRQHRGVNEAEASYIEASHAAEDAEAAVDGSKGKRGLLPYLKFRSFWAMCLGWLGFNGVFYGLLTWGPLYLAQAKGFDLKTIGWSTLVIFGAGFVGEIIQRSGDRRPRGCHCGPGCHHRCGPALDGPVLPALGGPVLEHPRHPGRPHQCRRPGRRHEPQRQHLRLRHPHRGGPDRRRYWLLHLGAAVLRGFRRHHGRLRPYLELQQAASCLS